MRRLSLDGVTKLDFLASLCLRPASTGPDNRRSKRLKRMEEDKSRCPPRTITWKEGKVSEKIIDNGVVTVLVICLFKRLYPSVRR